MKHSVWATPVPPITDLWTQEDLQRYEDDYRPKDYDGHRYDKETWDNYSLKRVRKFERELLSKIQSSEKDKEYSIEELTYERLVCLSHSFRYGHNRSRQVYVTTADAGGSGGDELICVRCNKEFLKWQSDVLNNYPKATLVVNKNSHGVPGKGQWKIDTDRKVKSKGKVLENWGSSR